MSSYTSDYTHNSQTNTAQQSRPHIPSWEHFTEHDKTGVRGYGHSQAEAFAQTALALMAAVIDPHCIQATETFVIECRAADPEQLLLVWLNALCEEVSHRKIVCCAVDVHINGQHLYSTLWGEKYDPLRHRMACKTDKLCHSEAHVAAFDLDFWQAQCVMDT